MKTSVQNMLSPRTYNQVANQFEIITPEGKYFQSYSSVIVFKANDGTITLDEKYYNYSRTTIKYRNQFLNETSKEVQQKIDNGEYKLVNLN